MAATYITVRPLRNVVLSAGEIGDEMRADTEPSHGYQEHDQVVNHQVGEVTFVVVAALANGIRL